MSDIRIPNAQQQRAIDFRQGPLRIIAGAGSGKSTTLVASAIALVASGAARPDQILALTFTDAAAEDLRQKMNAALQPFATDTAIDVDTYNAFGSRIVVEHANRLNLPPQPRVITPGEGFILLWRAIDEITFHSLELTSMRGSTYGNTSQIGKVLNLQSRLADEDRAIDEYREWALEQEDTDKEPVRSDALDRVAMLDQYERTKRTAGAIDFADQIRLAIEVLQEPEVQATYGQRYRFLMVDEFQDTNYAQRILVRQLGSAVDQNVRVVGDPYQAIYGFRGAAPDNLERFADTDFPLATKIDLGLNYRSTQQILDVANALWDDAPDATGTMLSAPADKPAGPKPTIVTAATLTDEIAWIAKELTHLNESGIKWSEMTILVRKNAQKRQYWKRLSALNIPIEAVGGTSLFEQQSTRLIISMLRVLVDQTDDPALAHLLSSDRWGIDDAALYQVGRGRNARTTSLFTAAEHFATDPSNPLAEQVADCVATIRRLAQRSRTQSLHATIDDIQRAIFWTLDDLERESLNRLFRVIDDFEAGDVADPSVAELVAYLDLKASDGDDTSAVSKAELGSSDTVKIMTVHAAKGLEWPVVIIAAANSSDFSMNFQTPILPWDLHRSDERPPEKKVDDWKRDQRSRETRRIAYVATTRAEDRLYITWSAENGVRKKPSTLHDLFAGVRHHCDELIAPEAIESASWHSLERFIRNNLALFNRITASLATGLQPTPEDTVALSAAWESAGGKESDLRSALTSAPIRIATLRQNLDQITATTAQLAAASLPGATESPRLRLSYSSLSEFLACPHRYYLHYVVGLPTQPGNTAGQYGTAVHAAIHDLGEAKARGESPDPDALWPEMPQNVPSSQIDGIVRHDPRATYEQSIDARAKRLFAEEPFTLRLSGVDVTGFIDRVQELPDSTIEIVDFKTNWDLPSDEDLDSGLQLPIYLLAMRDREQSLNLRVQQGTLFYLRHNYRHSIQRNDEQLDTFQTQIETYASQIRALDPTAHNASPKTCQHCDFKRTCKYNQSPT